MKRVGVDRKQLGGNLEIGLMMTSVRKLFGLLEMEVMIVLEGCLVRWR